MTETSLLLLNIYFYLFSVIIKRRYMSNKIRSSKYEKELFFWKFTLLNAYKNIYNIEQILSNEVSTKLMYLWIEALKVVSATFLLVCFLSKREHLWNKEECFLFHLESSFCSWDNQILTFQIFKCHDVIKCPNMKHKTHFTE